MEDQAYAASRRLSGYVTIPSPCEWVGHDVMIRAAPMTLDSASHTIANAKQFIRTQTLHRITQRQGSTGKTFKSTAQAPRTRHDSSG